MNPFLFKIWGSTSGVRQYIIDAKIENWNRFKSSECFIDFYTPNVGNSLKFSPCGEELIDDSHITSGTASFYIDFASRNHATMFVRIIWLIYSQFVCSERANASSACLSPYFYLYNSTSNVRYFSAILISPLHCGHPFRGAEQPPLFETRALKTHLSWSGEKFVCCGTNSDVVFVKRIAHTCSTILNSHTFRNKMVSLIIKLLSI